MRTEVEELGYEDESTKISGDRKKCPCYLLPLYNKKKRVARSFCNFVFLPNFRLIGQLTEKISFV